MTDVDRWLRGGGKGEPDHVPGDGLVICGDCDGVGWVEGGIALQEVCERCDGSGSEPFRDRSYGYRYEVTAVRGAVPEGVAIGSRLVERDFKGLAYSWTVIDIPTGATVASWDGRYIGVWNLAVASALALAPDVGTAHETRSGR